MQDNIRLKKHPTKPRFKNANCKFCHEQIPKATKMKRIPTWKQHENVRTLRKYSAKKAWGEF